MTDDGKIKFAKLPVANVDGRDISLVLFPGSKYADMIFIGFGHQDHPENPGQPVWEAGVPFDRVPSLRMAFGPHGGVFRLFSHNEAVSNRALDDEVHRIQGMGFDFMVKRADIHKALDEMGF